MSESNGTPVVQPESRIGDKAPKGNRKAASTGRAGNGLSSFMERAGKLPGKKSTTFKGDDDDATVTITVQSFPGFNVEDVVEAASQGVSLQAKMKGLVGGKVVTRKGIYEGASAQTVAEDFFSVTLGDESE